MKKTMAIIMALALLITALAGCGSEAESKNDTAATQPESTEPPRELTAVSYHEAAESFAGGSGTAEDPFQISEVGHLVLLHEMLKNEAALLEQTYTKAYYIMTADIALNDTTDFANWSTNEPEYGWEPIGARPDAGSSCFEGVFDGNGHTISGMYMDVDGDQTETVDDHYGLFAELWGTVRNLTIESSYMRASGGMVEIGSIAGSCYNATIENCHADSIIELYTANSAGGITGYNGTISHCSYTGTINQLDDSFVHVGGISGSSGDVVSDCEFSGTLNGKGYTGGIVGFGESVKDCVNKGTVTGETAGGIIADICGAGTNMEIENPQYIIENNINEGKVSASTMAGGIIGWVSNDESDISISVIGCENRGQVVCDEAVAGIIAKLSPMHSGPIIIENCVNSADISGKNKAAGIICDLHSGNMHQKGAVTVSGCKNTGDIISEGPYSAGIITYFLIMGSEVDFPLTVENCSNEGAIESTQYAGGILGFSNVGFNSEISADRIDISDATKVTLSECHNTGSVTATNRNSMVGGIVGVLGTGYIPTEISNCVNSGDVTIDFTLTDEEITELQGVKWTEFFQSGGGIVGRVGDALKLTLYDGLERDAGNIDAEEGNIVITGCKSTGKVTAPDYSFILNKYEQPLFVNYLGGIVGQCSATDAYVVVVKNCTYTGAERGLGDMEYPDFGAKK